MSFKNKIQNIGIILNEQFLSPFFSSIFFLSIIIRFSNLNPFSLSNTFYLYTGLISGFLAFFLWFKRLDEENKIRKIIVEFCSPLFLMSLFIITIINYDLFINEFGVNIIKNLNVILAITSFISGFIAFYSSLNNVEIKMEREYNNEKLAEQKREKEFHKIYPITNKILILKNLSKWMYKEGWIYSIILSIIIIIGFSNIFINLSHLPLHQDEIYHFSSAYGLKETGTFTTWNFLYDIPAVNYTRNCIYTSLVFISSLIFGFNEFAGRFVSAFFGIMGIFGIYFICKKIFINKKMALVSAYMYSVNDVVIYFSRFLRGYIILILLATLIFYLCYKLVANNNNKSALPYSIAILASFIVSLNFHATAFLLLPLILFSFFLYIKKKVSIKKHLVFYAGISVVVMLFILNIIGLIKLIDLPFNIYNHINLNINLSVYDLSYFYNILNPYNIPISILIIMPLTLTAITLKNKTNLLKMALFNFIIFIPLILSAYFFKRYEDFRYIAIIQGIFILYLSFFITRISYLYKWKNLILIALLILFINFQFPYFPQVNLISKEAIANFENTEGQRIHRRTAVPESNIAFDYLFNSLKTDKITIIRLSDGGINWDDNYYLNKYLTTNSKKVSFYTEKAYYSGKFDEIYNSEKKYIDLDKDIDYETLIYNDNTYIIANLRHLTNKKLLSILDDNCKNISSQIGIIQYDYFPNYQDTKNNYYPNLFKCF